MALIQRNVQLHKEDIEWFEERFPKTSLSGILGLLLHKFRDSVGDYTIEHYAEIAARELKEEIE